MMNPMSFKIRLFDRVFDADGDNPFKASAVLDGEDLLISIAGSNHRLRTVGRGADEWGEFAVIEPGEWTLDLGFVLTVEPEFSEDEPPGCRVRLARALDRESREQIEVALRSQGVDPHSVNILAPPSASISIFFHQGGSVTGWARASSSPPQQGTSIH